MGRLTHSGLDRAVRQLDGTKVNFVNGISTFSTIVEHTRSSRSLPRSQSNARPGATTKEAISPNLSVSSVTYRLSVV